MIRVLFVCTGNICRSPMAEAVFRQLVKQAGLAEQIEVDSAGTSSYEVGEPTHPGTVAILRAHGIAFSRRARQITERDVLQFDYLIALDSGHLRRIEALAHKAGNVRPRIARLMDYAPQIGIGDVPDPYYDGNFELTYELVLAGSRNLLAKIREEHNL